MRQLPRRRSSKPRSSSSPPTFPASDGSRSSATRRAQRSGSSAQSPCSRETLWEPPPGGSHRQDPAVRFLASAAIAAVATVTGFHVSSAPLSQTVRSEVVVAHEWQPGCPVSLSQLRVLSVTYHGFDGQ